MSCRNPTSETGILELRQAWTRAGEEVTFACLDGYHLREGNLSLRCQLENGSASWDGVPPYCIRSEETGIITLSVGIALVVVIFAVLIVVDFCFCRKRRVHHKKKRCRNDGNRPKAFLSRPESCLKLAIHMSSGNAFRMHAQIAAMLVAKGGSGKDENRTPRTKKKKHHGNENGVATLPRLAEERKRGDTFQDGHLQDSQRINDWGKLSRIYFHKEDTRSLDKRRHAGKVAPLELDSSLRRSNLAVAFYLEDKGVAEEEITNSAIFETPYSDRILTDHPEDRTASPPELQNPWADLSEGLHSYPV